MDLGIGSGGRTASFPHLSITVNDIFAFANGSGRFWPIGRTFFIRIGTVVSGCAKRVGGALRKALFGLLGVGPQCWADSKTENKK
jgi:hypothetical protein